MTLPEEFAMLNPLPLRGAEAVVRYEDADFTVLKPGRFVRCAVSGAEIPLEELRYWNVEEQEAYRGLPEAVQRWKDLNGRAP
jgi:hypothetical protein